jgi:hypothetical protein
VGRFQGLVLFLGGRKPSVGPAATQIPAGFLRFVNALRRWSDFFVPSERVYRLCQDKNTANLCRTVAIFRSTVLRISSNIYNHNTGIPLPTHLRIGVFYACIGKGYGYNVPQAKPGSG